MIQETVMSSKKKKNMKTGKNGESNVSVFATGFNNPRGLKFGPDCYLYVAEAGLGGTRNTADICPEIQPPAAAGAPFLGSPTGGRISKVNAKGLRTTVTDDFLQQYQPAVISWV